MERRALSLIKVCATSRWVRFVRRGRRASKTGSWRVPHSCRDRRLRLVSGEERLVVALVNASAKGRDEQAQKSSACISGRLKSLEMMLTSSSSSMCSCTRNAWRFGARSRHALRVSGFRKGV